MRLSLLKKVQRIADPEVRQGVRTYPPPEKSQKGFLSNTGPNPLKHHKAAKPAFNVGPSSARQRNAIQMAFRWRADDGLLSVLFGFSFPFIKKDRTLSGKTFWIRACSLRGNGIRHRDHFLYRACNFFRTDLYFSICQFQLAAYCWLYRIVSYYKIVNRLG